MEYIIIDDLNNKTVYTTDDKYKAKAMQEILIDKYGRAFFVCGSNLNPSTALQQEAGQLQIKSDVAVPDRS
jgi:hypothetical protein